MKFFLDTANLDEIRKGLEWGIIDGVTTNPTLIAKEKIDRVERLKQICELVTAVNGDVSAPVLGDSVNAMASEGMALAALHPNIVVKIPCTEAGVKATAILTRAGIRTNVTLVFSAAQALLAAKAGAYIVSPFIGRVDDLGGDGIGLIRDIVSLYRAYGFNTQVLAASVRSPKHVMDAARAGAHIATMPLSMLSALVRHPLTDSGLATMLSDYRAAFQGDDPGHMEAIREEHNSR